MYLIICRLDKGITFDKSNKEIREISNNEGLKNYTFKYLPKQAIIKICEGESFANLSPTYMIKKDLLNIEVRIIFLL